MQNIEDKKKAAVNWFIELRDKICKTFEKIEEDFGTQTKFERKKWSREGGGGGEMSIMRNGKVFEKVGVNFSEVNGQFPLDFAKEIPGTSETKRDFWASGVSVVAHMLSPFVPAVHMNTRMICTQEVWFGGGSDLTPTFPDDIETAKFHKAFKNICDNFNAEYYPKFKKYCDEYFYLKHRNEPRGIGGIFFDNMNSGNWEDDFEFTKSVGKTFYEVFNEIVRDKMHKTWSDEDKTKQLIKRGRYVEFNLLYDRGTRFGLMTGANPEALLMSLPPEVKWP